MLLSAIRHSGNFVISNTINQNLFKQDQFYRALFAKKQAILIFHSNVCIILLFPAIFINSTVFPLSNGSRIQRLRCKAEINFDHTNGSNGTDTDAHYNTPLLISIAISINSLNIYAHCARYLQKLFSRKNEVRGEKYALEIFGKLPRVAATKRKI